MLQFATTTMPLTQRFSLRGVLTMKMKKHFFLIDEAHNLVSRARDMFSAKIDYDVFKDAESKWKDEDEKLRKGMASVKRQINALKKQIPENSYDCHQKEAPDKLVSSLFSLQGRIERWLDENPDHFYRTELQDLYFYISDFTRISDNVLRVICDTLTD